MNALRQFCTFWIDGHFFGVEVHNVQEVLRYQEITQVPLAAPAMRGLINLRGQIVPALYLRRRLELADRPPEHLPFNVVVNSDNGPVSFLVDHVGEVVQVDEPSFEPPPNTLRGVARQLIKGAYKLDNQLLLVLDPDTVLKEAA
jgi:purine-binding chemotaxis protein CheW